MHESGRCGWCVTSYLQACTHFIVSVPCIACIVSIYFRGCQNSEMCSIVEAVVMHINKQQFRHAEQKFTHQYFTLGLVHSCTMTV